MSALPTLMSKIDLDNTRFENGINEASTMMDKLNKKMQKVSASMKASFDKMEAIGKKAAIGLAAVAGAVTGVTKAAGNLESAMIRLEAVTAGNSKELAKFEKAIKRIRAGSAETLTTVTDVMAKAKMLGSDLGLTTDEIIELVDVSEKLSTIWGTDFMGTVEGLMYGLSGATRQLRQYGIQLSETELAQIAINKGFTEGIAEMSEMEKAQLRYEVVMEKLQTQMGLAEEAGASFNVQLDRLKNAFIEVATEVGKNFLEDVTGGLTRASDLLLQIANTPALTQMIADFLKLGLVIAGLGTIIGIMGKMGNLALMILVNGFTLLMNPITWVVALLIVAAFKVEGFAETWKNAFTDIKDIWIDPDMTVFDKIGASIGTVTLAAVTAMQLVGKFIADKLGGDVAQYMEKTNEIITNLQDSLNNLSTETATEKLGNVLNILKELFALPGEFIFSAFIETDKTAIDNLMNIVTAVGMLRLFGVKGKTAFAIGVGLDLVLGEGWTANEWVNNMIIKPIESALVGSALFGMKTGFGVVLPITLTLSGISETGKFFAKDIKAVLNNEVKPEDMNFLQNAFNWSQTSGLFKGFAENLKKVVSKEDLNFFDGFYAAGLEAAISFSYAFHKVIQGAFDIVGWIGEKINSGWDTFVSWGEKIAEGIKKGIESIQGWIDALFGRETGPESASKGSGGGKGGTFSKEVNGQPVSYRDILKNIQMEFDAWLNGKDFTGNPVEIGKGAAEGVVNSITNLGDMLWKGIEQTAFMKELEAVDQALKSGGTKDANLVQLMMRKQDSEFAKEISFIPERTKTLVLSEIEEKLTPEANPTLAPSWQPEPVDLSGPISKEIVPIAEAAKSSFMPFLNLLLKPKEMNYNPPNLKNVEADTVQLEKMHEWVVKFAEITRNYTDTTAGINEKSLEQKTKEVVQLFESINDINDSNLSPEKRSKEIELLTKTESKITSAANETTTAMTKVTEDFSNLSVDIPELTERTRDVATFDFQEMLNATIAIGGQIVESFKTTLINLLNIVKNSDTENKEGLNPNWTPSGGVGGKVPEGGMLMSLFNPGMIWEGFLKRMNSYALASAGQASSGNTQSIERAISDGVILMGDLIPTVTQLGTIIKTGIEKETPATVVKETAVETDNGVKDALTNFQTGFGEVINPLAEKLGNLDKVIQDKLGETDSAVLNLVKDLFSMMTGLVQSLANSNAELEVQLAGLDDAMSTAKNELVSSTEQVNQTLKNIQNGTNTAALKSPEQLTGLYQDKFNVEGAYTSLDALGDKSDETTNALDSFEAKLLTALSGVAETLNPLNIVTGWIGSLQSGLQGLISAIDPIAAIFRGINKALKPVMDKLMKPLEHLGFLIGKALIPVVQFLAKVFEGVAYIIAGVWNALASVLNVMLGWLGVAIPMINFGESWEGQETETDEMSNTAGWHQPINNTFNVTFTGNTVLDTDDEAMELLASKFLQYCREHDIEVVT